jgi:hypothetical protein
VLRVACCVLRVACCVLRVACCVLRESLRDCKKQGGACTIASMVERTAQVAQERACSPIAPA